MRSPQQSRSASSSDRMLEATLALLGSGGLAAVTVAAVAQAAGTSNGSLYHRFGDRTGLLLAAQERLLADLEVETAAAFALTAAEPSDADAVLMLARAAVSMYDAHRPALRAFLVEGRSVPELEPRNDAWAHALARTITGWLVGRLGARPSDAEAAYRIIHALGVTRALLEEPRISPVHLAPEALAESLARAVLAVVQSGPSRRGAGT